MKRKSVVVFFCVLSLAGAVFANTRIVLKSGIAIEGHVNRIDERRLEVSIREGTGEIRLIFEKGDVVSIADKPYDEFREKWDQEEYLLSFGDQRALYLSLDEIESALSQKRELNFFASFRKENVSDAQIQARVRTSGFVESVSLQLPPLKALGVFGSDFDLAQALQKLQDANTVAFYDQDKQVLYYSDNIQSQLYPLFPNEILVRELIRALQNQHFLLESIDQEAKGVVDATWRASQCVIFGDAVLSAYQFNQSLLADLNFDSGQSVLPTLGLGSFVLQSMFGKPKLESRSQELFYEYVLFPYIQGAVFVETIFTEGGWSAVDALYQDLPVSSEQILHPKEKFLAERQDPLFLAEPQLTMAGFNQVSSGTLGEMGFLVLGKKFFDNTFAQIFSEGWGNDYYYLFENNDSQAMIIHSRWDSAIDANEAYVSLRKIMGMKHPALVWSSR